MKNRKYRSMYEARIRRWAALLVTSLGVYVFSIICVCFPFGQPSYEGTWEDGIDLRIKNGRIVFSKWKSQRTCTSRIPYHVPVVQRNPELIVPKWSAPAESIGLCLPKIEHLGTPNGPPWYQITIPMWLPTLFTLIGYVVTTVIYKRQPRVGCCMGCLYNLTGNTTGVCPECGALTKTVKIAEIID